MSDGRLQDIAETLLAVASPNMTPKQLVKAVKKKHPKASKKDVVRAAFYAVLSQADSRPQLTGQLHAFALSERTRIAA